MSRRPAKKVSDRPVTKTGRKTGTLVPQKHGGAILNGMAPNHVPGPGRPPDEIRAMMRRNLSEVLPDILERYKAGTLDHVRVAEFLARYGLGTKDETTLVSPDVTKRLTAQVEVIASKDTWQSNELLERLSAIWTAK